MIRHNTSLIYPFCYVKLCNIVQSSVNKCNTSHITRGHHIYTHLHYVTLSYAKLESLTWLAIIQVLFILSTMLSYVTSCGAA
jgi:hypothetical protein